MYVPNCRGFGSDWDTSANKPNLASWCSTRNWTPIIVHIYEYATGTDSLKYASVSGYMLRKRLLHGIADGRVENRGTKTIALSILNLPFMINCQQLNLHLEIFAHYFGHTSNGLSLFLPSIATTLSTPNSARFGFRSVSQPLRPDNQCLAYCLQLRQKFSVKN